MQPVVLTDSELSEVIRCVSPKGKEYAAARICRLLAGEHSVQTVRINTRCSVGNISDIIRKTVNPLIEHLGLYVACVKPPYKIHNQFGQPSGQMLWSFYRDAANDPVYDQDKLRRDLQRDVKELQKAHPNMPIADDYLTWLNTLAEVAP